MSGIDLGGEGPAKPGVGAVDVELEVDGAQGPVAEMSEGVGEPTLASTWHAMSGGLITDRLLEWPPDVFALTNVVLARAEAFRYALSDENWPPSRFEDWGHAVEDAGRRWSAWSEDRTDAIPKAIQFIEVAELLLVSLVCEDLAQNDDIAQLIRSVGPTWVITVLLDGPQLNSRWAARYASVLADDPGSAVLTLTSFGMVQRSRPPGRDASRVIALWKDPTRGVREISLEPGAHAVLLTLCMDRATRYSADRRWPVDNSTYTYDAAVQQVRAAAAGSGRPLSLSTSPTKPALDSEELTILTAWAEGVAEVGAYAPEHIEALLAEARAGATWRGMLGLPEPAPRLAEAIESLGRVARAPGKPSFDALLAAASEDPPGEGTLDGLARRALLAMLEERRTRQPTQASIAD